MSGFDNEVMYANNVDFTGSTTPTAQVLEDGELLIGSTVSPNIRVNKLTSSGGSITISNGAGSINLEAGSTTPTTFQSDSGDATPAANILILTGSGGISTSGSGNTITISSSGLGSTITGDTGGALSPTAGNWNIVGGSNGIDTSGSGSTLTLNFDVTEVPSLATTYAADSGSATPAANTLNVVGDGSGIDTSAAGSTVTVSFDVTEQPTIPTSVATDSGTVTPATNSFTVSGGTGISTSGATDTLTIAVDTSELPSIATTYNADTGSATPALNVLNIVGDASGIDTSASGSTVTVSFDVTEQPTIPTSVGGDTGSATPSTNSFTIAGGTGISTSGASSTLTVSFDVTEVGSLANVYTCDSGSATPAANNLNVLGLGETSTSGSGSTVSILSPRTAQFVVDASANLGTHTTIASALSAASSGDTIFIRPGTYTENLTLKAGVNLAAYDCDAHTPNVTIVGNATATFAGTCSISGIRLQTNAAAFLTVSGTSATIVNLVNCYLNASNATGISYTSSSSSSRINCLYCTCDVGTTLIAMHAKTSAGILYYKYCQLQNSGSTTTASTNTAGTVSFVHCFCGWPLSSGTTGKIDADHSYFAVTNTTSITFGGTGNGNLWHCIFENGTASCISISAGVSINVTQCNFSSTNTSAIAGAGQINYADLAFPNTSSAIGTTTQVVNSEGPSKIIGSSKAGGSNYLEVKNDSNTASSAAYINTNVEGTSAGDAYYQAAVSGTQTWSWGLDNSDSDAFVLASSTALGTTNVLRASTAGEITKPLQPAFLAYLASTDNNVTGDNTEFTIGSTTALTEVFDQNGDFGTATFTAPVTGRYFLCMQVRMAGITSAMTSGYLKIVTSNRTYTNFYLNPFALASGGTSYILGFSVFTDMDAADTATCSVTLQNGTKVADLTGSANPDTAFSGHLVC